MKKLSIAAILFIIVLPICSYAQSHSFETLRNKFSNGKNVYCFGATGFLARTFLWMAGEHDYVEAIREIRNIRMIVIPKSEFKQRNVTLAGFRKVLVKDAFESLVHVRDHGDDVSLYMQTASSETNNRYFLLVDSGDEVVGIEIKGYIDPQILKKIDSDLATIN